MRAVGVLLAFFVVLLLAVDGAGAAERVMVTGRATIGTDGEAAARRDALEDALFQAAIAGGADVRGFEMADNSIMVGDSVLLQASSRILDFEILSSGRSGSFYEVQIAAHVGNAPEITCGRPRTVHVFATPPEIIVSPNAPAWLAQMMPAVSTRLLDALAETPYLRVTRVMSSAAKPPVIAEFDYMSLVTGETQTRAVVPTGARPLRLSWNATAPHPGADRIRVELRATLGGGEHPVTRMRFETQIQQRLDTPARLVTVLSRKSRDTVARYIGTEMRDKILAVLVDKTCEPLVARLGESEQGGRFTVPLGRQDGLTAQSVGFAEGDNTPWTAFRVVDLGEARSVIAPINSQTSAAGLTGRSIRFVPEG